MALNSNNRCDGCGGIVRNPAGRRMTIEQLTIQHNRVCPGAPTPPTKGTTTNMTDPRMEDYTFNPDTVHGNDDEYDLSCRCNGGENCMAECVCCCHDDEPTTLILTDEEADEAQASTPLPVFVFGTLRPGAGNDRTWHGLAEPRHDGECWVEDHRLVSNGAFPYCLPSKGDRSIGCLIVPHAEFYDLAIKYMDSLEGVPTHYTRKTVAVTTPDGVITAWYYIPEHWQMYADYRKVIGNDWSQGVERRSEHEDGFARDGWWAR